MTVVSSALPLRLPAGTIFDVAEYKPCMRAISYSIMSSIPPSIWSSWALVCIISIQKCVFYFIVNVLITLVSHGWLVAPSFIASLGFLFLSWSCLASVRFFTWRYWSHVWLRNWKASKIWIFPSSLCTFFWMQKLVRIQLNFTLDNHGNWWRWGWSRNFLYVLQAFFGIINVDLRPLTLICLVISNLCMYLWIQSTLMAIII